MTTTQSEAPPFAPNKIYELSCAYWGTRVLLSADEVGVFGLLGEGPATPEQIAERLDLHPAALGDFLDALVALGLLERDGDRYRNAPEADYYLVPGKRYHMGGYMRFVDKFMFPTWEGLTDILRTGKPQYPHPPAGAPAGGPDGSTKEVEGAEFFEHTYGAEETGRTLLDAADALNTEVAWELTRRIDWTPWTDIVDLGGARGNVAGILLQAHPHLRATVFDMPPVEPLFHERMASLGLSDRARFQGGDWFSDGPLPEGEALLCGHALHNWTSEQRRSVIGKAFHAVRPGGVFMIYDLMIDPGRDRLNPLLLSLLMRLGMGGSGYSAEECRELMLDAGFSRVEDVRLQDFDGHTVVIGHKEG